MYLGLQDLRYQQVVEKLVCQKVSKSHQMRYVEQTVELLLVRYQSELILMLPLPLPSLLATYQQTNHEAQLSVFTSQFWLRLERDVSPSTVVMHS